MILEVGSKVLVVHRRLYEKDRARYFVGNVDCCEAGVARVNGFTWSQDPINGKLVKKEDPRTKVVAFASQGLIIYALPPNVRLSNLSFDFSQEGRLWLTDKENRFQMDLTEACHH